MPKTSDVPQAETNGHQSGYQEYFSDPKFVRRGRTGMVIAIGITAVNGYVWYNWQLAISATKRNDPALMAFMSENFTCSKKNYNEGRWWTVVTSGFSHMEIWHILANTIGIVSFYPVVAARVGIVSSLVTYLACIGGGSAASLYHAGLWRESGSSSAARGSLSLFSKPRIPQADIPGLGASAGVFGLFTISMLMAPTATVSIFFIPFPAWLAWGLLTGVDSYGAMSAEGRSKLAKVTGVNLGHEAHLGGSATALFLSVLLMPRFWLRR